MIIGKYHRGKGEVVELDMEKIPCAMEVGFVNSKRIFMRYRDQSPVVFFCDHSIKTGWLPLCNEHYQKFSYSENNWVGCSKEEYDRVKLAGPLNARIFLTPAPPDETFPRCEKELLIEEYFGLSPRPGENHTMTITYSDLVDLLYAWEQKYERY